MTLPRTLNDKLESLKNVKSFIESTIGSDVYIKMDKSGAWTYGTEAIPVEADAEFAVDPDSIELGYSAFDENGNRVGEEMRNHSEPLMSKAELPTVAGIWQEQIGFKVRCLNGDDEGLEGVIYQRSAGGRRESLRVVGEIFDRLSQQKTATVPVIRLNHDKYKHKRYGWIYTPQFEIVEWLDPAIEEAPEEPEEPKTKKEQVTRPRRRSR